MDRNLVSLVANFSNIIYVWFGFIEIAISQFGAI